MVSNHGSVLGVWLLEYCLSLFYFSIKNLMVFSFKELSILKWFTDVSKR